MSRPAERIGVEEFRDRLVALCLDGRAGLPRHSRDRHDVVTLRRELVDRLYLRRDDSGREEVPSGVDPGE